MDHQITILKRDARSRVRSKAEAQAEAITEFRHSGLSASAFARIAGIFNVCARRLQRAEGGRVIIWPRESSALGEGRNCEEPKEEKKKTKHGKAAFVSKSIGCGNMKNTPRPTAYLPLRVADDELP